ncbi:hypothetical protein MP638_007105 [Amoeboaphelidium occidentale]|nr:hypothetical protein MP638_007105 [Amoeboaphelidium occidentale]
MILRTGKGYFSKSSRCDSRARIMDRFMNASLTHKKVEPVIPSDVPEVDEKVLDEYPGGSQLPGTDDNFPYADKAIFTEKNISASSSTILGKYYEHLVIKALQPPEYGLSVNGHKKHGKDKGIDFYGRFTEIPQKYPFIGQCKFYRSKSLPVTVIRELIGTLDGLKSGSEKPPFDFDLNEELIGMVVASVPLSKDSVKLLQSTRHPMIFFRFIPNSAMTSNLEKPPFDFDLNEELIGMVVASVPLSKDSVKLLQSTRHPMIFFRFIPNSAMTSNLFSSYGDGHMQSLMMNETACSLLDPYLKIETRYDEKLSVALKRSVRHEIFKYHRDG